MVFATPIIELILSSKRYISREYFHENYLKTLKISTFINLLGKNVVIFASIFFKYVKIQKSSSNI